jgi:hypothetical protein
VRALLLAGALALAGCVHVFQEPALEMPQRPSIHFFRCGPEEIWVCMTEPEAVALGKWIDKLDAFEAGRQRLLGQD